MFWIAVLAALSAAALIQLGALSVWVHILSFALAGGGVLLLAVVVSLIGWALMRRYRGR